MHADQCIPMHMPYTSQRPITDEMMLSSNPDRGMYQSSGPSSSRLSLAPQSFAGFPASNNLLDKNNASSRHSFYYGQQQHRMSLALPHSTTPKVGSRGGLATTSAFNNQVPTPKSGAFLAWPSLKNKVATFLLEFDSRINQARSKVRTAGQAQTANLARNKETIATLQHDTRQLQAQQSDLKAARARQEAEAAELTNSVKDLRTRVAQAESERAVTASSIKTLQAEVARLRAQLRARHQSRISRERAICSEIATYVQCTGMHIVPYCSSAKPEPSARSSNLLHSSPSLPPNTTTFRFDIAALSRPAVISLRMERQSSKRDPPGSDKRAETLAIIDSVADAASTSLSSALTVVECWPLIHLDDALLELSLTRDFFRFLRRVRAEFATYAQQQCHETKSSGHFQEQLHN